MSSREKMDVQYFLKKWYLSFDRRNRLPSNYVLWLNGSSQHVGLNDWDSYGLNRKVYNGVPGNNIPIRELAKIVTQHENKHALKT